MGFTPHTGLYLRGKEWKYRIGGWNVVDIAEGIVRGMYEDGVTDPDQMEDQFDDYMSDTLNGLSSHRGFPEDDPLPEAVKEVFEEFMIGIEAETPSANRLNLHDPENKPIPARDLALDLAWAHLDQYPNYYSAMDWMGLEVRLHKQWHPKSKKYQ
jgi:hypothetical protein